MVSVIVCIDTNSKRLVSGPEVSTRGWVHGDESGALINDLSERVRTAVTTALKSGTTSPQELKKIMRKAAGSFVSERTRRRPMIVPVVLTS